MPEVTISYKKPETLKILKGLAKYFDFTISSKKDQPYQIKGVTILPATEKFDDSDVSDLFKDIDAAKLRKESWERKR